MGSVRASSASLPASNRTACAKAGEGDPARDAAQAGAISLSERPDIDRSSVFGLLARPLRQKVYIDALLEPPVGATKVRLRQ
jgi:hypothetical protein